MRVAFLLALSASIGISAFGCSDEPSSPHEGGSGEAGGGMGGDLEREGEGPGTATGSTPSGGAAAGGMGGHAGAECDGPVITLTVRDFNADHPDFQDYAGITEVGCGMVAAELGADMTPTFVSGTGTQQRVTSGDWESLTFTGCTDWTWSPGPVITSAETFADWYHDVDGVNQAITFDVELAPTGAGSYVYDTASFFPIDGQGFAESMLGADGQMHNFHFTTEAHVNFEYVAGQLFTFRGDDDLWVFVNGRLAVDLGGTHMPIQVTLDLDAQAQALGITPGAAYQMDIFHAERFADESNFRVETNISCFEQVF